MAERFDSPDLIVTLFAKGRASRLLGSPLTGTSLVEGKVPLEQFVQVDVRGRDGQWHYCEIPLRQFADFMFVKVFPAVAKRLK
jgi:hypothetical protein